MPLFASDPYASYGRAELLAGLADIRPTQAGVHYAYSNLAVGLLGETLANIGGDSFNQLIQAQILDPLKLSQTHMTLGSVPDARLATGYAGDQAASAWNFQALAGAGSIRSSITDLLAYGVAHLNPPEELAEAMQLATRVHYQQDRLQVGLGWHIRDGVYWHNGGTGGFRSMLMIDPQNNKVVAAITNSGQDDVEDLAVHLMDPAQPMRRHDFPVPIDAAGLATYTGTFQQQDGDKLIRFDLINDQLYFKAEKQPKMALEFVGNDRFRFKLIKATAQFLKSADGTINAFEFKGWGEAQRYLKVEQ